MMSTSPTLVLFLSTFLMCFLLMTAKRMFPQHKQRERGHQVRGSMLLRLLEALQSPAWRRYGAVLFVGKAGGLVLLLAAVYLVNPTLLGHKVYAADAALKGNDIVNPINTVWTLVAAFLVFGMQVDFTMLEAGFCRSRETVNVLMECVVDTCLCGLLFYAFGFSFMFSHGNGLIGYQWFFLPKCTSDL